MGMDHWWNDTDKENPAYYEMNVSQCRFVHLGFHMQCPGIEPRFRRERPANVTQTGVLIVYQQ